MNDAVRIEVLGALKTVFEKYGDDACFAALAETVECLASVAQDEPQERSVFNAVKLIDMASRKLKSVRSVNPDMPSVADAFDVKLDLALGEVCGYTHCACRDCLEIAIASSDEELEGTQPFCNDCCEAGCADAHAGTGECLSPGAYGGCGEVECKWEGGCE